MKKKKRVNGKVLGGIAVGAFSLALIFSIVGLSNTVEEIDEVSIAETPSAILASAGVAEGRPVSVPVLFYDQKEDECVNLYDLSKKDLLEQRQFEWTECYYLSSAYEQGMVDFELNDQSLPVVSSGELTPNRGLSDTTRWFSVVDGKSASYTGDIQLDYDADTAEFSFYKEEFYPLDKAEFSKSDKVNRDGHNQSAKHNQRITSPVQKPRKTCNHSLVFIPFDHKMVQCGIYNRIHIRSFCNRL